MFRLRFFTEATAAGEERPAGPQHDRRAQQQLNPVRGLLRERWWRSKRWPPISSAKTGSVSAVPIQKRRVMSRSSGLSPVSPVASTGSSAMPQMGQLPGPIWRTCGCIGQVYSTWLWSPLAAGFAALPARARGGCDHGAASMRMACRRIGDGGAARDRSAHGVRLMGMRSPVVPVSTFLGRQGASSASWPNATAQARCPGPPDRPSMPKRPRSHHSGGPARASRRYFSVMPARAQTPPTRSGMA